MAPNGNRADDVAVDEAGAPKADRLMLCWVAT